MMLDVLELIVRPLSKFTFLELFVKVTHYQFRSHGKVLQPNDPRKNT